MTPPLPKIEISDAKLAAAVAEFNACIEAPIEPSVTVESIVEADPAAFASLLLKAQADRFAALKSRVALWRQRADLLDQLTADTTTNAQAAKWKLAAAEGAARQTLADAGLTAASWSGKPTPAHSWANGPGTAREKGFAAEVVRRHPLYTDAVQRLQEAERAAAKIAAAIGEQTGIESAEDELAEFAAATLSAAVAPQPRRA